MAKYSIVSLYGPIHRMEDSMKHSLNARKTKDEETPIGNYQEVRKQINKRQIERNTSISGNTNIGEINVTKPLKDQQKLFGGR